MSMVQHRPCGALAPFVDRLWWSERQRPQAIGEHMLPTGAVQLVFALDGQTIACRDAAGRAPPVRWSRGIVHGPQTTYYLADPKPAGRALGVSFHAGAAGAVLGVPADELLERHVPIEDLWGGGARVLHERLCAERRPSRLFEMLELELLRRIARPLLMHPAVAHVLGRQRAGHASVPVAALPREVGYSPRHFIALFRGDVGVTPGQFHRIERFGRVARILAAPGAPGLARIAADAGYADQAHLTREFRAFAGVTPSRFRPVAPDSPHHHVAEGHHAPRSKAFKKAPRP